MTKAIVKMNEIISQDKSNDEIVAELKQFVDILKNKKKARLIGNLLRVILTNKSLSSF